MWSKRAIVMVGMAMLCSGQAYGREGEFGARFSYQQDYPSSSLFAVPAQLRQFPTKRAQQEAYLHLQQGVWTFRGQIKGTQQINGGYTDEKATINEWYADFSIADIEASIGKKVISWGVGYGYRPLDVIQRESRQALRSFDLEGVPLLVLEYFTAESATTAVLVNRVRFNGFSPKKGVYEGALKYSTLLGNSDVHLLLHQRQGEEVSVGGGISSTAGDHMEWHGSMRYLSSYTTLQHKLSGKTPSLLGAGSAFSYQKHQQGILALLGASWTWESGYSVMLEAWHDDTSWSRGQWQELFRINREQKNMLALGAPTSAVYGNLAANNQVYSMPNPLKDTLFMRLSYDGDTFDPNLSLLYTPADGGMVFTASADHDWNDHTLLFASARMMSGKKDSAYRNAADHWQLWIGLQMSGAIL